MSDAQKVCRLLQNAIARLDREFCQISTADGRNWDSGATALIAIMIGNTLTAAGLGDSNGVLCRAAPCNTTATNTNDHGWTVLNTTHNVKLKEVVHPHSPSRTDERERIQNAHGWVVTDSDQIPRVCEDLAVSRALGDREFKAAYNSSSNDPSSPFAREVLRDNSIAIGWGLEHMREDYRLFPEPVEDHRFVGGVISSVPEINSERGWWTSSCCSRAMGCGM